MAASEEPAFVDTSRGLEPGTAVASTLVSEDEHRGRRECRVIGLYVTKLEPYGGDPLKSMVAVAPAAAKIVGLRFKAPFDKAIEVSALEGDRKVMVSFVELLNTKIVTVTSESEVDAVRFPVKPKVQEVLDGMPTPITPKTILTEFRHIVFLGVGRISDNVMLVQYMGHGVAEAGSGTLLKAASRTIRPGNCKRLQQSGFVSDLHVDEGKDLLAVVRTRPGSISEDSAAALLRAVAAQLRVAYQCCSAAEGELAIPAVHLIHSVLTEHGMLQGANRPTSNELE
jgi:hypothetical protein